MHDGAAGSSPAVLLLIDRMSILKARTLFVRRDVADSSAAFGVGMTTMKSGVDNNAAILRVSAEESRFAAFKVFLCRDHSRNSSLISSL